MNIFIIFILLVPLRGGQMDSNVYVILQQLLMIRRYSNEEMSKNVEQVKYVV
jgi:hypothetical protein